MIPPMVCFVTWNRAGLTAQNLTALLNFNKNVDFELYIIDNGSKDDTWTFVETLQDERIKEKKRFNINRGVIYALNYALSKRKKDQYFIYIENDVYVGTNDWITQFLRVMETFPDLGMVSAVTSTEFTQFTHLNKPPKTITKENITYYQYPYAPAPCHCMRPELIDIIGYWNEETHGCDPDTNYRINQYTHFKTGHTTFRMEYRFLTCNECLLKDYCSCLKKGIHCCGDKVYKNMHGKLIELRKEKESIYYEELRTGKRTVYCASIHDKDSMCNHVYHKEWAEGFFQFFIDNT